MIANGRWHASPLSGTAAPRGEGTRRAKWGALIRHKVDRLEALGVTLRCGVEATAEGVLDWRPDIVIAATGTRAGRPGEPEGALAQALDGRVTVHRIGDGLAPRDVEAAILDGHAVGRSL